MFLEINPIITLLISFFFILGIYFHSIKLSEINDLLFLKEYFYNTTFITFFAFLNFFLIILSSSIIFFGINSAVLKIISIFFVASGVFGIKQIVNNLKFLKLKNSFFLVKLLIFLLFLISLFPITDPDSLDYHMSVPKMSLQENTLMITDYWLHSHLFGYGEVLILIGQNIAAFNVSQITQFFGLLMICSLIINYKNDKIDLKQRVFIIICILVIPANLFLIFSSKPQLFSICSNFVALFLAILILPKIKEKKQFFILFFLIALLSLSSTQFKYSFYLSSGIIISIVFLETLKKKFFIKGLLIFLPLLIIIILPREIYEYVNFSENIIKNFFNPIPESSFQVDFINYLRSGIGNNPLIPIWIFLPIDILSNSVNINFGKITNILGISILLFIFSFNKKNYHSKLIVFLAFIYFIFGIVFGQATGRFFYEPFLWLFIICLLDKNKQKFFFKIFRLAINLHLFLFIIILIYSSIKFLPGNLSISKYKEVLRSNADGYQIYEWTNKILPNNSVFISSHRSIFLSNHKIISYELRLIANDNEKKIKALEIYNKSNPTYIVYTGNEHNNENDLLQNCRGKLIFFKKDVGKINYRNPFNKTKQYYDGFVYEYDKEKVLECIKNLKN